MKQDFDGIGAGFSEVVKTKVADIQYKKSAGETKK